MIFMIHKFRIQHSSNLIFRVEKVSETLSLKRCDLENLKLNNSFSMINLFSSDPDRARAEKSAHLEFEISRLEEREIALKEKLKSMEDQIEENLKVFNISEYFFNLQNYFSPIIQCAFVNLRGLFTRSLNRMLIFMTWHRLLGREQLASNSNVSSNKTSYHQIWKTYLYNY